MYAGVFTVLTLDKGDLFYCEGRPCTAPPSGWFICVRLVIKLKVIYGPFSAWFHLLRSFEEKIHIVEHAALKFR